MLIIYIMSNSNIPLPASRARLASVVSEAGSIVRIKNVVQLLGLTRVQAAKLLSRWAEQGWLRRVGPGVYVSVQLDLLGSEQVVQDPWILVPALFGPAYIGGRTAAEYWDLTEQIFKDIVVLTSRTVRAKTIKKQNAIFTLKHVSEELIFGTKTVWRDETKVAISDIHRTIVDMLGDPTIGGGIQHVADCFARYISQKGCDIEKLIAYADRVGNGVIFKRLGFLAELYSADARLIKAAKVRLTKGLARLDPTLECSRIVTRWQLRVPPTWVKE